MENRLREIDFDSEPDLLCKLCFRPASKKFEALLAESENEEPMHHLQLGTLYEYVVNSNTEIYRAHFFCLLFSSGLNQAGDEDEGIKGFLLPDILKEWRRGQRLKCSDCDQRYATVGCAVKGCRKTFHVPCALEQGCLLQFCDDFKAYCRLHRPEFRTIKVGQGRPVPTCGICLKSIRALKERYVGSTCCGGWHHLSCVSRLAYSAGYFFKCPLCNNKETFEHEMKLNGVFVPERDAAWELDDSGAFSSLIDRHGTCDADKCICPLGRNEDGDCTPWEIILCRTCGAQGIHVSCIHPDRDPVSLAENESLRWSCPQCKEVASKLPPTIKNEYAKVKRHSQDSDMSSWLQTVSFKLHNDVLLASMKDENLEISMKMDDPRFPVSHEKEVQEQPSHPPSKSRGQKSILDYFGKDTE